MNHKIQYNRRDMENLMQQNSRKGRPIHSGICWISEDGLSKQTFSMWLIVQFDVVLER